MEQRSSGCRYYAGGWKKRPAEYFWGNEGDGGYKFPETSKNLNFDDNSNPNSKSYPNKNTSVNKNLLDNQ